MSTKIRVALSLCLIGSYAQAATHRWVSSNGNFSDPLSWSTGSAPEQWSPGDRAVFDGPSQANVSGGAALPAIRVAEVIVTDNYSGAFLVPLELDAANVVHNGFGRLWFKGPDTDTFRVVYIAASTYLNAALLDGKIDHVFAFNGQVVIATSCRVRFVTAEANESFGPLQLVINPGPSIELLHVGNGGVQNNRPIAAGHRARVSGSLVQYGAMEDGAIIEIIGGTFKYEPSLGAPPIARPILDILGGSADFSDCWQEVIAKRGVLGSFATIQGNFSQSTALEFGLVDLYPQRPNLSVLDRTDSDGDGVVGAFDVCSAAPDSAADTNGDCAVDLLDAALLQNEFTGP